MFADGVSPKTQDSIEASAEDKRAFRCCQEEMESTFLGCIKDEVSGTTVFRRRFCARHVLAKIEI